jgi:hypothetical protein
MEVEKALLTGFLHDTFGIKPSGEKYDTEATKSTLGNIPQMLADGTAQKGNDLGLLELNDALFDTYETEDGSETYKGIGLGCPYAVHLKNRPFLDTLYGDGTFGVDLRESNPSGTWTYEMLKTDSEKFVSNNPMITDTVVKIWAIVILYKVSFGVDVSYDDAKAFVEFKDTFLNLSILPQAPYPACVFSDTLDAKMKYIDQFITMMPADMDAEEKRTNANQILEAMVFAGGVSVPQMVIVILSRWSLGELDKFDMSDEHDIALVTMEALRRDPPVAGLCPVKILGERIHTYHFSSMMHTAFTDPLKFMRRDDIPKYKRELVSFADQALPVDGAPGSARVCPGKSLAYHMILSFLMSVDFSKCKIVSPSDRDTHLRYKNVNLKIGGV